MKEVEFWYLKFCFVFKATPAYAQFILELAHWDDMQCLEPNLGPLYVRQEEPHTLAILPTEQDV